ncbi:TVP38/TMEM64 family protein [Evansella tamaricis]|uniref:TVP38/TMEM64 family membrane protein n=1 Tax=Evansella tamaricis TaxID=2069301 RepID=A0ABS6JCX2_9BACI|nr:TVP38/TMEM64 family protein [Evansella tamaricis]MBU9711511.1 TVP38/TMEM64 family protein [Evansella tamaricis]
MSKKFLLKLFVFIVLVVFIYVINGTLDLHPEDIHALVISFGWWSPLVFILMFSVRPFMLFPASILAIAGGLSFGPIAGPIVTYIGSLSGATISFLVARKLGKRFVQRNWKGKGKKLQEKVEEKGFIYVLALRLIPVVNFDFVTYLSALSKITFHKYIAATMVGIIPGTLAFNFLGATFLDLSWEMIVLTCGMFILAFFVPLFIQKKMADKNISIDLFPDERY